MRHKGDEKLPSPFQKLDLVNGKVFIKRDDLIHPLINGNKWRKLQPNFEYVLDHKINPIVSVGGAFSNHLYSLAAAGRYFGVDTIGFVKSHALDLQNPILRRCSEMGMELSLIDRKVTSSALIEMAESKLGYFVPEGGSNHQALEGTRRIIEEIRKQVPSCSRVVTSVGSGGTLAGMLNKSIEIVGFTSFDVHDIRTRIERLNDRNNNYRLVSLKEKFGKFGNFNTTMADFAFDFYNRHGILLDPMYNLKAMMYICSPEGKPLWPEVGDLVVVNTGGVQGWLGVLYRYPDRLKGHPLLSIIDQLL